MKDSWLDRSLHRRLAGPVTAGAVQAGIPPNVVTVASLIAGLGGAGCLVQGTAAGAALGVVLYLVAVVLDHADGDVARLTGATSRLGHWLDLVVDTTVHATLVLAMGWATASRVGPSEWAMELAGAGAAGVVAGAAVANLSPVAALPRGLSVRLGRVLDGLTNRHGFYVLLVLFAAASALAPGLLPFVLGAVAVGSHAYWVGRVMVGLAARIRRSRATAGHAGNDARRVDESDVPGAGVPVAESVPAGPRRLGLAVVLPTALALAAGLAPVAEGGGREASSVVFRAQDLSEPVSPRIDLSPWPPWRPWRRYP